LKQPVGADDDIDGAFFYLFDDSALFGLDRKRLRQATFTGIVFEALDKGGIVLFGQYGGGHQHGHLLGFTDRQKGGPQGHFGFP
jgi:hypothetical protein